MPQSSCVRCSRPLDLESAGGLCAECLRTAGPGGDTSRDSNRSPAPDLLAPTVSAAPAPESADRTHTYNRRLDTATGILAPEQVPLPLAPAGYELLRELGSGGMGVVYLARDHTTEQLVAMKFLQRPGNQAAYDRFLVELRALAGLNHPHIIRVLGHDFLRADPYFSTEYVPGGSLAKKLLEDGPLEPAEAARLMATAARAIHAANSANVIHRDLKPSNILLAADGTPRISDFGLAKRTDRDDQLTLGSGPLGTPAYMSPEQAGGGAAVVDGRTDVYGLGATLYHLVTGLPPFTGSHEDVIRRVVKEPPTPPRAVRRDVPIELEAIVLKCLEKDPARRYQSAGELATDLDTYLAGGVPKAPLLTWRRRMAFALRRNRRGFAIAGAVALLMVSVFALGAAIWPRTKPVDPPDPLEVIQKELAAGRPVTLIGETGKPAWHRWYLGSPELGTSPTGDGSCSYESMGYSLLEVCPDPMTERYLIRAKLRFINTKAENGNAGTTSVGIYFGRGTTLGNAGLITHTLFKVTYDDLPRPPPPPPAKPPEKTIRLNSSMIYQQPDKVPAEGNRGVPGAWTPIARVGILPGPWRTIEVEVTPERVRVRSEGLNGAMIEFADLPGDTLRAEYARLQGNLDAAFPNHGINLPGWSPRMPLGIWNLRAAVDVKDVSVTPLK